MTISSTCSYTSQNAKEGYKLAALQGEEKTRSHDPSTEAAVSVSVPLVQQMRLLIITVGSPEKIHACGQLSAGVNERTNGSF